MRQAEFERPACFGSYWPRSFRARRVTTRTLSNVDVEHVMPLLIDAFANDPGFRYIVPDEADWQRIARRYFALALRQTLRRGHGIVDRDGRAVSLWEAPAATYQPLDQLTQLLRLTLILGRNLGRALSVQRFTESYRPRRAHWYLTYIASDPAHRGRGYGSRVLAPMIDYSDRTLEPIYLECSNHDNLGFYLRHGFNIVAEVDLPGGRVWPMLRNPATR